MGLTAEQLAARVFTIGASDVPAILGVHPWRSPLDVWMEKAPPGGKPPVAIEQRDTEQTDMGNDFEEVVLRRLARQYECDITRDQLTRVHWENPRLTATPDGLATFGDMGGAVVEAKLVGANPAKHWTDPDTKEPTLPDYVYAQNVWQMGVCGAQVGLVGAQVASTTWRHFRREFDAELFDSMREQVERFVVDHVDTGTPPPRAANEDRIEYLKKRFPRSDGTLQVVDSLPGDLDEYVRQYILAGEKLKAWEAEQEEAKAAILERLAESDGFKGPWGTLSYKGQKGRVQYGKLAEFLAGGEIREELLEKFRGEGFRVFRCAIK